jgi:hypothetical protein
MSNTSTVTPYEEDDGISEAMADTIADAGSAMAGAAVATAGVLLATAAAGITAAAVAAVATARWLGQETDADRATSGRFKAMRQAEFAQESRTLANRALRSTRLHLRDTAPLLQTARNLGYREATDALAGVVPARGVTLLQNARGERLALERCANGQVVAHSAGDTAAVQALLHQHTLNRALQHLAARGMAVETARLPNGEVQIVARETTPGRGGKAEVRAQVRADGTAWVDVDKVRGNRCEEIVRGLADAVGGAVSTAKPKDAYFQRPGEPARTRVKG